MRDQDIEFHVTVVAWLHIIESILYIGGAILLMIFFSGIGLIADDPKALGILSIVGFCGGGFLLLFGIPTALAGWGLLKKAFWARVLAMVLAILGLFLFPIGTIIGVYVLWVLTAAGASTYFGDDEETKVPQETAAS